MHTKNFFVSAVFALLFTSCMPAYMSKVYRVQPQTKNLKTDGKITFTGVSRNFQVQLFVPPIVKGKTIHIQAVLQNVSDTIQQVRPWMFGFADTIRGLNVVATSPVESIYESLKEMEREKHLRSSGYGTSVETSLILTNIWNSAEVTEEEELRQREEFYQDRYLVGEEKLSRLVKKLDNASQYWLKENTLFPTEEIGGTVVLEFSKIPRQGYFYFYSDGEILRFPVRFDK